ncbi:MAG: histidine kinase [Cellulosilyticaceae bacterium]
MPNAITLLEIMEKTVYTLETNKNIIVSIIKSLQNDHSDKKQELLNITSELPDIFAKVEHLTLLDKQLRQKLALASCDFSEEGHQKMKSIFDYACDIHSQLLQTVEREKCLITRRDALALELKHQKLHINQAESMAQQLLVSLSYLQSGINQLGKEPVESESSDDSLAHYLSFYKCVENEKVRIARDLHDGPAQHIASVQMRIDFCRTLIQQDLSQGLLLLEQLKSDLSTTLSDIRDILFNLNPAPLEKYGLKSSIENMLYNSLSQRKTQINFYYELDNVTIPSHLQNTMYRIVQELINNIKKHAAATHIVLRLSESDHFLYIHLEDNGIGFDVPLNFESFCAEKKSYGLSNIATRIQELKGHLKVTSKKNKGSLFKIQLPLLPM